jgi:hypothetical protein
MFAEIPIMVVIPMMIVLNPSMLAVPISGEIAGSIVIWGDPTGARVRGTRPIARVPLIMSSDRVPVAPNPGIIRTRARGNRDYSGRRRRAYSDTHTDLGE